MHILKSFTVAVFLLYSGFYTQAQDHAFSVRDTFELAAIDRVEHSVWADINNDSSLDLVVWGEKNGNYLPLLVQIDSNRFVSCDTLPFPGVGDVFNISDVDNDNRLDFVYTVRRNNKDLLSSAYQKTSMQFLNSGFLDSLDIISGIEIFDMNNDGKKDLLYFGKNSSQPVLRILWNQGDNVWKAGEIEDVGSEISNMFVFDANSNGVLDIIVAGKNGVQPYTTLFLNDSTGFVISDEAFPAFGEASFASGDFDGDGYFDIIISGKDEQNNPTTVLRTGENNITSLDTLDFYPNMFMADLNTDGICDLSLRGQNDNGDFVNHLLLSDSSGGYSNAELPFGLGADNHQVFADYDWDGDLDLATFHHGSGVSIILYENTTDTYNAGPSIPASTVAFAISDEVKIFWEGSEDDHTAQESITYDVYIGKEIKSTEVLSPAFDLNNEAFRTMVKHGNSGFEEQLVVAALTSGGYSYGIQAIDNAFHAKPDGVGTNCNDLPIACGSFVVCEDIVFQELKVCQNSVTNIPGLEGSAWYSVNDGFLGFTDTLTYQFSESDTVYATVQNATSCDESMAWIIKIVKFIPLSDVLACADVPVQLQVEGLYDSVTWVSYNSKKMSSSSDFEVTDAVDDIIILTQYNGRCIFTDSITVFRSKPDLGVTKSEYKLLKGDKVQLNAFGALQYQWFPAEGLTQTDIANPVASPNRSIRYFVQGIDSLGCMAMDSVMILIDDQAFIPNLFTPNQDGNNDALLIYGLNSVKEFSLKIYTRSGSLVYETKDPHEASTIGWNGTNRGTPQPNGVYYWKASGILDSGKRLLLGGRESGAVHLMR